ncbi:Ras-related protein Rab7 [Carex littledalei]|uniref:Ras-related protein Rab7 n=1 Tax=Carex littledalei TaxID=544730 RepID=A0A833VD64_9POAL|nr:Ras-related protein Rab7 [Carex littledalei]
MQRRFRRADHRWIATVYEEFQYLIQAPTKVWLDSVASRGFLILDGVEFPVLAWEPDFEEGLDLIPIWVRLRGFPKSQWAWTELEKVFNPLGAHLLELDPGTGARYDWRFIRAKFGVCDPKLLPPVHYVERLTPSGKIKVFDISIEVETDTTESVHAWRARLNGRPFPNGTEFGLLGDVDAGTEQRQVEGADTSTEVPLENQEVHHGDAEMEDEPLVQPGLITPGCKPGSGGGLKRDEEDGAAPGSGKKGTVGNTPKRVGISKPSSSGTKQIPRSGGSGSRPIKKLLSPVPSSSPIPLSPNPFQPLSPANPHTPTPVDTAEPYQMPSQTSSGISLKLKKTWGSRKKHSPVIIKKRLTIGMAARRRAAAFEPPLPSLNTPAVSEKSAQDWCAANGNIPYFETSAKEDYNVDAAFLSAAKDDAFLSTPEEDMFIDKQRLFSDFLGSLEYAMPKIQNRDNTFEKTMQFAHKLINSITNSLHHVKNLEMALLDPEDNSRYCIPLNFESPELLLIKASPDFVRRVKESSDMVNLILELSYQLTGLLDDAEEIEKRCRHDPQSVLLVGGLLSLKKKDAYTWKMVMEDLSMKDGIGERREAISPHNF